MFAVRNSFRISKFAYKIAIVMKIDFRELKKRKFVNFYDAPKIHTSNKLKTNNKSESDSERKELTKT